MAISFILEVRFVSEDLVLPQKMTLTSSEFQGDSIPIGSKGLVYLATFTITKSIGKYTIVPLIRHEILGNGFRKTRFHRNIIFFKR